MTDPHDGMRANPANSHTGMTQHNGTIAMSPHRTAAPSLDTIDPEQLRKAIDSVALLRMRIVRNCLFGNFLAQSTTTGIEASKDTSHIEQRLREEFATSNAICRALETGKGMPDATDNIAAWISSIATQEPDKLAQVMKMVDLSQAMENALDHNRASFGPALNAYSIYAREGFVDLITALCDALWDAIAEHQRTALRKATEAANTLGNRLTRLEHIGRHVRLVSLNASVEAAHAGDVGKGLMVIAQEFKELAEEIQILAKDAHADMAAIS